MRGEWQIQRSSSTRQGRHKLSGEFYQKQQGGWLVHYIGEVGTCSCHCRAAAAPGDGKSGAGNECDG